MRKRVPGLIVKIFLIGILYGCSRSPDSGNPPVAPLKITSIHPTSGAAHSIDTIEGNGFSTTMSANRVFFGNRAGTVMNATVSQLVVRVPDSVSTANISVEVNGQSVAGPVFTARPYSLTISSISPVYGLGGIIDTISGTGFSPIPSENTVWFGGVQATITSSSSTQLIVTVPSPVETGPVTVVSNGVTVIGPTFTYVPPGGNISVEVTTIAGNYILGYHDSTALNASFGPMMGIAADNAGNIYVADANFNVVRRISVAGLVTTFAGSGSQGASTGPGSFFYAPVAVAVGSNNSVYVANEYQHKIQVITAPETVVTLAGGVGPGFVDGPGNTAAFDNPLGVAVDVNGNIFVADEGNNAIRKITAAGIVTTVAGMGSHHPGADNGIGTAASFSQPRGIAVDHDGNVYVADRGNFMIRKITPAGVVTTVAGLGNPSFGDVDGPVSVATFSDPMAVVIDSHGNLYVADYFGNKIRKISIGGIVSTLAGTGATGAADGSGATATFNGPTGLAIDGYDNIYVVDANNFVIRKIVMH